MKETLKAQAIEVRAIIERALREDIGSGDLTTSGILRGNEVGKAVALAKAETVIAGIDVFRDTFLFIDENLKFTSFVEDGAKVQKGDLIAEIEGSLMAILTAERTALNLFQRMCGIATMTRKFVDAIAGTKAKIIHTRKTAPGLRILDTYAVRVGGGYSHRFGLFDGVLIKENHIAAAGGISAAVNSVRRRIPITVKVEVEVEKLEQIPEALEAGADIIMCDNMTVDEVKRAVDFVAGRIPLEASGNITLDNVKQMAQTGVDYISSGSLTHSVKAADVSLRVMLR